MLVRVLREARQSVRVSTWKEEGIFCDVPAALASSSLQYDFVLFYCCAGDLIKATAQEGKQERK